MTDIILTLSSSLCLKRLTAPDTASVTSFMHSSASAKEHACILSLIASKSMWYFCQYQTKYWIWY